ncbi:MAG: M23 family metallopeptidase [Vicinamibacteria bacterium]|nr:M23 family metallopeptidase [Vicinamibacteria bacterium]
MSFSRRERGLIMALALGVMGARAVMAQNAPVAAAPPLITKGYGRAAIDIQTSRANPGGVFAILVRGARWASVNTLLDGRRGSLAIEEGKLFGLVPLALDTEPSEHKLSLFFPGSRGRGGATSLMVPVTGVARPSRPRTLSQDALAAAATQTALGHGRFLLAAIRTRDLKAYHTGPLRPPVDGPIVFPFGGAEDYGMEMGPVKDGLMGEHHRGVDYDVPAGTTVRAPGSGIILLARSLVFSGETVVIGHGRGLVSVLSHLTHVSVREGDVVNIGTAVGTSGKSGIGALTPHLCFSVYLHSLNVDPEALMDASLWP